MQTENSFYFKFKQENYNYQHAELKVHIAGKLIINGHIAKEESVKTYIKKHGIDALEKILDGEFALFIIVPSLQKAYLFSNLFASYSLYYFHDIKTKSFHCSTTIKAITSSSNMHFQVNLDKILYRRNTVSYDDCELATFVKGIYRLKGGVKLCLNLKTWKLSKKRYKHVFDKDIKVIEQPASYFIESYQTLITKAISRNFNQESNPLVTLSGGFDSSIIYAIATQHTSVNVATICTETSFINNEIDRARELTSQNNSPHVILPVSFKEEINIGNWVRHVLEMEDSECGFESFLKSQLLHQSSLYFSSSKMCISGMGSDQFNGGTTTIDYSIGNYNQSWEAFISNLFKNKWEAYRDDNFSNFFQFAINFSTPTFKEQVIPFSIKQLWEKYIYNNYCYLVNDGVFLEGKIIQSNNYLSIFPFLEENIINLISRIPPALYSTLFFDKQILRKAFSDLLPKSFEGMPKFKKLENANEKKFSYLRSLVYGHNRFLLKLVFDISPFFKSSFNIDYIMHFLDATESDKYYPALSHLLRLINIGLLDAYLLQGSNLDLPKNESNVVFYTPGDQSFDKASLKKMVFN